MKGGVVRITSGEFYGTGVIFEATTQGALILTNYHVVERDSRVEVVVQDRDTYPAQVVGYDAYRDLAVLEICCGTFRPLNLGNSEDVATPGTEVIAIGYALGFDGEATVTRGIVSAVRYDTDVKAWVIQTDTPINPGNSGGPLMLTSGDVIGINTFGFFRDADGDPLQGLNFAVAGQTINDVLPDLQQGKRVSFPTPTPTVTPRPTPTNTPVPVSASWQTYTNDAHGYEIDFPKDWTIDDSDQIHTSFNSPDNLAWASVFVPPWEAKSARQEAEDFIEYTETLGHEVFEVLEIYESDGGKAVLVLYRLQSEKKYCLSQKETYFLVYSEGRYFWITTSVCDSALNRHGSSLGSIVDTFSLR